MKFKDMKLRYKVGVGVVTGAAVVSMAGGAFAYFSGGAGTGAGTAGVVSSANVSRSVSVSASLHTGNANVPVDGSSVPIDITVTNTHPYSIQWANDSVSIASLPTNCPAGSFTITGSSAGANTVPAATTVNSVTTNGTNTVASGFSINFVDLGTGTNQDSCLGGTITFTSGVSAT